MPGIEEAAEKLSENTSKGSHLQERFDDIESIEKDAVVKESELRKEIEITRPGKVAGVDGGLIKKRYSTGDLVAIRAVAAILDFSEDKVESKYVPSKSPEPDYHVFEPEEADSIDRNAESERLKAETSVAIDSTEKCDMVLMDGSVVPSYLEDNKALENYTELFKMAGAGKLIGVVEDSYGLKLGEILEEKLGFEISEMRDTLLMDMILEEGERSFVRRYAKGPVEHPVLGKLEEQDVNRIHTFYVKLSSQDLPLRIDYFGDPEHADDIASKLLYMKSSDRYTVPSPIVEADRRAKLDQKYLKRLEKRFSPEVKRRDRRVL
ncbi:MAG: DNA double-strand break repair nuclease NurA [Nanohaloarchaea archaeon]|nr:DNA double-strand break repair nuclease NurA [Candidatus Nanohaloarchaea archaeon]